MPRRFTGPAVFVVAAALIAAGAWWLTRPGDEAGNAATPVSTVAPTGAPEPGSCWRVTDVRTVFPWPDGPVDCAAPHTAEVFHVGQVAPELIRKGAAARGDEAKLNDNLMYAQARRACTTLATTFLGGTWHGGRIDVVANWVTPARSGFFGCALVETADPAAKRIVTRTGGLRDALRGGESAPLAIACVSGSGSTLAYTPCDQPHTGEYAGSYTITPPDAPFDEAAVRSAASKGCDQVGTRYLGLAAGAARTDLRTGYVGPLTAVDWLGSDQTFACYVLVNDGTLRGSVRGVGTASLPR